MTDTEKQHGVVRSTTCYMIDCADCGPDCWDEHDFNPHFPSEEELRRCLVDGYGWTFDRHGRALCMQCTREADCARDGHQWREWEPSRSDSAVLRRWCDHCSEFDSAKERAENADV